MKRRGRSLTASQLIYFGLAGPTEKTRPVMSFGLSQIGATVLGQRLGILLADYTLQQNTGQFNIVNPLLPGTSDGAPTDNISYTASPLFNQSVESTAVFGQVDWDITESLMLSVGGRWLMRKKRRA